MALHGLDMTVKEGNHERKKQCRREGANWVGHASFGWRTPAKPAIHFKRKRFNRRWRGGGDISATRASGLRHGVDWVLCGDYLDREAKMQDEERTKHGKRGGGG